MIRESFAATMHHQSFASPMRRSHAVLEIVVKRRERNNYNAPVLKGKLSLVDLAGR
jgi:hypothetical protein